MDISDGANQPILVGPTELLDLDNAFSSARQCVAAQQHRNGAGMTGHAGQACSEPGRACDCAHGPDREIETFQYRSLLDMQFDIGQQFAARPCRRTDMIGIEAELDQRIAHRNSGAVP